MLTLLNTGKYLAPLSISEVKQIAGRAGRFSSPHPEGFVTTLNQEDLRIVRSSLAAGFQPLKRAGLGPTLEILEAFHQELPEESFEGLLVYFLPILITVQVKFQEFGMTSKDYFICDMRDRIAIARLIEDLPTLTLEQRYTLTAAPVTLNDQKNPSAERIMHAFCTAVSQRGSVCRIENYVNVPDQIPTSVDGPQNLEIKHKTVLLYLWLRYLCASALVDTPS